MSQFTENRDISWASWCLKSPEARIFLKLTCMKTSKLHITGRCGGNPPVIGGCSLQQGSNVQNFFYGMTLWWSSPIPVMNFFLSPFQERSRTNAANVARRSASPPISSPTAGNTPDSSPSPVTSAPGPSNARSIFVAIQRPSMVRRPHQHRGRSPCWRPLQLSIHRLFFPHQ